jgi:hypothetical protein
MLLVALLPLLALPGALAGPFRQSPVKRETPIVDGTNPLRFTDTVPENGVNRYDERLALAYPSKLISRTRVQILTTQTRAVREEQLSTEKATTWRTDHVYKIHPSNHSGQENFTPEVVPFVF